MGNKQANGPTEQHPLRSSHPRLQGARLSTLNGQPCIKITVPLQEKEYAMWAQKLLAFQKSTSKLMLPIRHTFTPAGGCGEIGSVDAYYPSFPYLLSDQIHDRKGKRRAFTEQELWYLMFSLSKAEHQNHSVLGPLSTLSPNNVFLNEEGSIKVPNAISWPGPNSRGDRELDEAQPYLSPQEVETMQAFTEEVEQLQGAGEMFSLGLILISAGNLADFKPLYDLQKGLFDEPRFQQALCVWSGNRSYSQVLRGVTVNLCSRNPSKRMTAKQLWTLLSRHQESIAKKNNFLIDNATDKVHEGVQEARRLALEQIKIMQKGEKAIE